MGISISKSRSGPLTTKHQRRDPATEQGSCRWRSWAGRACDPGAGEGKVLWFSARRNLPHALAHLLRHDPKWEIMGVDDFVAARGIDLVYYGNQRQLECDFVVSPGADPGKIKLSVAGAGRIRVDKAGDLVVQAANDREVRWQKPAVYQEAG